MMWSLFFILFSCFIFRPASSDLLSSSTDAQLQQLCARFPGMEVCQPDDEALGAMAKRKSAYMRFGRAAAEQEPVMEKRKSAYMRFGKRSPEDENVDQLLALNEPDAQQMEKRKSAYMRFGKRKSAYMRFGRK
uniref:FMRFamide-like peptide n=1 Tax=Globodera pallida TaxID=36090 RepID=A0A183CIN0_GLOPA